MFSAIVLNDPERLPNSSLPCTSMRCDKSPVPNRSAACASPLTSSSMPRMIPRPVRAAEYSAIKNNNNMEAKITAATALEENTSMLEKIPRTSRSGDISNRRSAAPLISSVSCSRQLDSGMKARARKWLPCQKPWRSGSCQAEAVTSKGESVQVVSGETVNDASLMNTPADARNRTSACINRAIRARYAESTGTYTSATTDSCLSPTATADAKYRTVSATVKPVTVSVAPAPYRSVVRNRTGVPGVLTNFSTESTPTRHVPAESGSW